MENRKLAAAGLQRCLLFKQQIHRWIFSDVFCNIPDAHLVGRNRNTAHNCIKVKVTTFTFHSSWRPPEASVMVEGKVEGPWRGVVYECESSEDSCRSHGPTASIDCAGHSTRTCYSGLTRAFWCQIWTTFEAGWSDRGTITRKWDDQKQSLENEKKWKVFGVLSGIYVPVVSWCSVFFTTGERLSIKSRIRLLTFTATVHKKQIRCCEEKNPDPPTFNWSC